MTTLSNGTKAPNFSGLNQNGDPISLVDYKGKKLILYFYPKDNTPGCTSEACNLNENLSDLTEKGFSVVGVSPDSSKSHLNFIAKHKLNFDLISDPEKNILQAYNAWGEKKMYGRTYMGVLRKTYIINEDGIIQHIIEKVKTKTHTEQIYAELGIS